MKPDATLDGRPAYSLSGAARAIRVSRVNLYGVLLAYGINPQDGDHPGGRSRRPRVLTPDQVGDVRRRLDRARAGGT